MEIVQWTFDFFDGVLWWGMIPGFKQVFYIDFARVYAYGVLGTGAMATSNIKCAANTYEELSKDFLPDYVFEQDNDFYLQSISAAQ